MSNPDWLSELRALVVRFAGLGIGPDLAALTVVEAQGLFEFLCRLAAGGANAG